MLQGDNQPMDFTYNSLEDNTRKDKHIVPAWGQTPYLKRQSVFDRDSIRIGSAKPIQSPFTRPCITSPSKSNTSAGDILVSSKMSKERKDDIFCFGAVKDNKQKDLDVVVEKVESSLPVSPNKKRKRVSDSYEHQYSSTKPHNLPADIGKYINLSFSLFLILIAAYILLNLISTIHHDMNLKIASHAYAITQQVSHCANEYTMNRCSPSERLPAMQQMCSDWELCMLRDPAFVGRLSVAAETLAEVLNKLVDPLSYKTLIVSVMCVFGGFWVIVSGIVGFRTKQSDVDARDIHSSQPIVFNLHQPSISGHSGVDLSGTDKRIK